MATFFVCIFTIDWCFAVKLLSTAKMKHRQTCLSILDTADLPGSRPADNNKK